jgi:hypothetical protein
LAAASSLEKWQRILTALAYQGVETLDPVGGDYAGAAGANPHPWYSMKSGVF